ncbi:hypothetical protein BN2537_16285 [Streptomyces venezuelae]|nr:hypothetical protein BN2537_16285 [Streptomyces venezuelae]
MLHGGDSFVRCAGTQSAEERTPCCGEHGGDRPVPGSASSGTGRSCQADVARAA